MIVSVVIFFCPTFDVAIVLEFWISLNSIRLRNDILRKCKCFVDNALFYSCMYDVGTGRVRSAFYHYSHQRS